MPWFPHPRQVAGGVLALEACRFVRARFRIRRLLFGQAPVDSHNALSVFEAMGVALSCQSYTRPGGVKSGPRFMYGSSRCVRWSGYPFLIPSTPTGSIQGRD